MIAPCGMNCSLCISYLAMKNDLKSKGFSRSYCPGCLPRGKNCTHMKTSCDLLGIGLVRFCHECETYPCKRLKDLDKRYRTKYHMSILENLEHLKKYGMQSLLEKEEARWRCKKCVDVVCCHNGLCLSCDLDELRRNKKYRWGE